MNEQVVLFNYWVDCLAQSATEQGYFLAHSNKDFRLFRQYGDIEAIHVAKKLVAKLNNSTLCAYELNGVKRWNASEVLSLAQ